MSLELGPLAPSRRAARITILATIFLVVIVGVVGAGVEKRLSPASGLVSENTDAWAAERWLDQHFDSGLLAGRFVGDADQIDSTYVEISKTALSTTELSIAVGGEVAINHETTSKAKTDLAVAELVTSFILLMVLTKSLLIPVKAMILNAPSLTATRGAVIWIIQDGHLSGILGFTATGSTNLIIVVLLISVAFGLRGLPSF